MNNGWIKIDRRITAHWLWNDAERLKWWLDMLFQAAWEDNKILVGKRLITLRKGQFIASMQSLCKRWKRSRSMIEPFIEVLISDEMITKEVSHNISIITICNWEKYYQNKDAHLDAHIVSNVSDDKSSSYDTNDTTADAHLDAHPDAHLFRKNGAHLDAHLESDVTDDKSSNYDTNDAHPDAHLDAHLYAHLDAHKIKNIFKCRCSNSACAYAREKEDLIASNRWIETVCMRHAITTEQFYIYLDRFFLDCEIFESKHDSMRDVKFHFSNWLRIQRKNENYNKTTTNNEQRTNKNQRAGIKEVAASVEDYAGSF